jgi:hypothetical protein
MYDIDKLYTTLDGVKTLTQSSISGVYKQWGSSMGMRFCKRKREQERCGGEPTGH